MNRFNKRESTTNASEVLNVIKVGMQIAIILLSFLIIPILIP